VPQMGLFQQPASPGSDRSFIGVIFLALPFPLPRLIIYSKMDNQRRVVLLEAFEKNTAKVPSDRLRTAASRLQDHVIREE
jgi:hypothetical protein